MHSHHSANLTFDDIYKPSFTLALSLIHNVLNMIDCFFAKCYEKQSKSLLNISG